MTTEGSIVVIGGTSGLGLEVARHYADRGREVIITGRDADRTKSVADEIGGQTTGLALDLTRPAEIADGLSGVGNVAHLVIAAVHRDQNTVRDYNLEGAQQLVTMKLVGYTEAVHALLSRMSEDSSIVLFGGLAKERPYPGSTTVTTVNGGVATMVHTMAVELAPIRVNAIHPSIVGDTPFWKDKPTDAFLSRTPLGRLVSMSDVVEATAFLLENRAVTGINLDVDGGWLLK